MANLTQAAWMAEQGLPRTSAKNTVGGRAEKGREEVTSLNMLQRAWEV